MRSTYFVLLAILLGACKPDAKQLILELTVPDLLERVYDQNLEEKHFQIFENYEIDNFGWSIDDLIESGEFDSIKEELQRVKREINFEVDLNFIKAINSRASFQIRFKKDNEDDFSGFIKISEPVLINNNKAYFYFAMYCGNDCTTGNLVLVNRFEEKWRIEDVILLWGG